MYSKVLRYEDYYEILGLDGKVVSRQKRGVDNPDVDDLMESFAEQNNILIEDAEHSVDINNLPPNHNWLIPFKDI